MSNSGKRRSLFLGGSCVLVLIASLFIWLARPKMDPSRNLSPECGQTSVYHCARFFGAPVTIRDITDRMPPVSDGNSFAEMRDTLRWIGLKSEGRRVKFEELKSTPLPAIVHWGKHFVVVERIEGNLLHIRDGMDRKKIMRAEVLQECWDGNTLVVFPPALGAVLPAYLRRPAKDDPRVRFERLVADLGDISPEHGEPVNVVFGIRNDGRGDLKIRNVRANCKCAEIIKPEAPIPAGQTGKITVKYDASALHGPFESSVYVETSDPALPVVALTIEGFAGSPFVVKPRILDVGEVSRDAPASATLFVTYYADEPLNLALDASEVASCTETVRISQANVNTWVSAPVRPEKLEIRERYAVKLLFDARALPFGKQSGKIILKTGLTKTPSVEIPWRLTVAQAARSTPEILYFGVVYPGGNVQDSLNMQLRNGTEFRIIGTKSDLAGLTCEYPDRPATETLLKISYTPSDMPEGIISSNLTVEYLRTGKSESETLSVPICGYVSSTAPQQVSRRRSQ